ncbi:MAG: NUDIX domain-containing protein [Alteromonadaceae bacterium]|nr:NUDIX domain-containing protein [Alteromonadaceae bacterium]
MADIETLDSQIVYQNKWLTLREDKIQRRSGNTGIYSVVEKPDFAVIVPVLESELILVNQFRYPLKKRCWEFPQGACESRPDISPTELATNELREETGYQAASMQELGFLALAPGFCEQHYTIFIAKQLTQLDRKLDIEEEDLIYQAFDIEDVEKMILSGEIVDATTVSAFFLAKNKGLI